MTGPLIALALGALVLAMSAWLTHTDNDRDRREQDPHP